jgi:hypothetical protein
MKPESPPARPPRRRQPRVPPFYPVPIRTRSDGWTALRQADFLGFLAETGSITAAAELVGMSRKGAYALRAKPGAESFAAAWDAALWLPERKVTVDDQRFFAEEGLLHLRFFRGRYRGSQQIPDTSALLRLVRKLKPVARTLARGL